MTQSLDAFLWAEGQEESGGNYSALGPSVGGDRAYGKYQVMGSNVGPWTQQALGHSLTPTQFLNDPAAQEAVARTILGGYYSRYGPAGAAAAWFSGVPNPNSDASDGGTTVRKYVANILALMNDPRAASAGGGTSTGGVTGVSDTTGGTSPAGDDTHPDCLWGLSLPVVGYTCILTKGQGRAILGTILMTGGAIVGGAGLIILSAYGLKRTGALDTAAAAAGSVPGLGGAAGRLAAGAQRVKAAPTPRTKTKTKTKPAPEPTKGESE